MAWSAADGLHRPGGLKEARVVDAVPGQFDGDGLAPEGGQLIVVASLMSLAADDADLPADAELRAALVSYLERGARLAMHNSQPALKSCSRPRCPAGAGASSRPTRRDGNDACTEDCWSPTDDWLVAPRSVIAYVPMEVGPASPMARVRTSWSEQNPVRLA